MEKTVPFSETNLRKEEPDRQEPKKGSASPPRLFHHQALMHDLGKAKKIYQKALTNTLNYIHFTGKTVLVHLQHPRFQESLLLKAHPTPCIGDELTCHWPEEHQTGLELEKYQFVNLFIDDSQLMISVQGQLQEINNLGLTIQLPEEGYIVSQRHVRRNACENIAVDIAQNGFQASGTLLDFCALGFRVRVRPAPNFSFHSFNSEESVNIQIRTDEQTFFSGNCMCIRHEIRHPVGEIVFVPTDTKISRFKKRHYRNLRQKLVPTPLLVFDHPFFKKRIQLEVSDISTSGFSVLEDAEQGVLLPGMIIPDLSVNFAGAMKMKCIGQVIYREKENNQESRCGISILDMDMNSYCRFTDILINASDPHTHVSREIDLEELWEFFFDTGFIYPKKYGLIKDNRADFKKIYKRLYQESPEIAKHITHQKKGRILGHISMIRIYEKAWMIHHHAARKGERTKAGIKVLKQLMIFLNDLYRLPSSKMDYAVSFFRPSSRFPNRFFGDFARSLENNGGCSMDLFSYLSFATVSLDGKLPDSWTLETCSATDLLELDQFYRHYSGGLLLDLLSPEQGNDETDPLEKVYEKLGFFRKWEMFALKHGRKLKAVMIVNQSDLGFNLSELTNCIQVIVTDPDGLPWDTLSRAIRRVATIYKKISKVPVLIYPQEYVDSRDIRYERQYYLWILNVLYGEDYLKYIQDKFKLSYK